jgi:hypothetical protein
MACHEQALRLSEGRGEWWRFLNLNRTVFEENTIG